MASQTLVTTAPWVIYTRSVSAPQTDTAKPIAPLSQNSSFNFLLPGDCNETALQHVNKMPRLSPHSPSESPQIGKRFIKQQVYCKFQQVRSAQHSLCFETCRTATFQNKISWFEFTRYAARIRSRHPRNAGRKRGCQIWFPLNKPQFWRHSILYQHQY